MATRLGTVLAHPDDETFGTGGTLIRAVDRGAEVHSLCLTRGEAGWAGDPNDPISTRERLGDVRADELKEAGRRMGLASVTVLDHGDGKLAQADPRAVEADIVAWLRKHPPDVLITWGPDGGYGHPDHIAAGERCLAALDRASDARPKKVYRFVVHWKATEHLRRHMPEWADVVQRLRPWRDEDLGALVVLTEEEFRRKWAAMQAHRSQLPDLRNWGKLIGIDPEPFRYEAFLRQLPPQDGALERDVI